MESFYAINTLKDTCSKSLIPLLCMSVNQSHAMQFSFCMPRQPGAQTLVFISCGLCPLQANRILEQTFCNSCCILSGLLQVHNLALILRRQIISTHRPLAYNHPPHKLSTSNISPTPISSNFVITSNMASEREQLADPSLLDKIDQLFALNLGEQVSLPQVRLTHQLFPQLETADSIPVNRRWRSIQVSSTSNYITAIGI